MSRLEDGAHGSASQYAADLVAVVEDSAFEVREVTGLGDRD